jgi:hypothetical protein
MCLYLTSKWRIYCWQKKARKLALREKHKPAKLRKKSLHEILNYPKLRIFTSGLKAMMESLIISDVIVLSQI